MIKYCVSLCFLISLYSCSTKITSSLKSKEELSKHKTLAIVPFEINFDFRKITKEKFTTDDFGKMKQMLSLGLQVHLQNWLKSNKNYKKFTVQIQDTEVTNSILSQKNIRFIDLYTMPKNSLAKLLGVDAVMTSKVTFSQPNNEDVTTIFNTYNAVLGVFPFVKLASQKMDINIVVNNNLSNKDVWQFSSSKKHSIHSTFFSEKSQDEKLNTILPVLANIDIMLQGFSKNFPYQKKWGVTK